MANRSLRRLIFALLILTTSPAHSDGGKTDKYSDFYALSLQEKAGEDYFIEARNAGAKRAVFAIHGGFIEPGTTEIAEKIAGLDWAFYSFKGIKSKQNSKLHITSSHFNEPTALEVAIKADDCVSMHGYNNSVSNEAVACVGGGNAGRASEVAEALKTLEPILRVKYPCREFAGDERLNIVNRCARKGVQIEMSRRLRALLCSNADFSNQFAITVRQAMQ